LGTNLILIIPHSGWNGRVFHHSLTINFIALHIKTRHTPDRFAQQARERGLYHSWE
jgi:hypothetical protein